MHEELQTSLLLHFIVQQEREHGFTHSGNLTTQVVVVLETRRLHCVGRLRIDINLTEKCRNSNNTGLSVVNFTLASVG